ncbi:hypothetical protein M6B38_102600 [Iris pallida]|uniref:Uncharacterized protein n=1 Tax=Iris pallida TaxID=29817 RepID=A0AAX6G7G3_IRIPA|nr:hypothetical protein M6B38_105765 [Iris pallida]KAJ6824298.1 hypothetical protein M6B38_102600 [Iris pallida]
MFRIDSYISSCDPDLDTYDIHDLFCIFIAVVSSSSCDLHTMFLSCSFSSFLCHDVIVYYLELCFAPLLIG